MRYSSQHHWSGSAMLLAALLMPIVLAGPVAAHLYRELRDWTVTCGNGLTCSLQFGNHENVGLKSISFERTAEPEALVTLAVGIGDIGADMNVDDELVFSIDGDELVRLPVAEAKLDVNAAALRFEKLADVGSLIEAMTAGSAMKMRLADAGGTFPISLAGVTAGLLFIDEAQDRLDRVDALQAVGDRPMLDFTPAGDIPAIADLPAAIRDDFSDDAPCGGMDAEAFRHSGAFFINFADSLRLIGVPCGLGGAYNQPYVLYSESYGEISPLAFPDLAEDGPTTVPMAYNLSYEPLENRLTAFFKGRGIGDCGSHDVWRIGEDGYGLALTLVEKRVKGDCDGDYAGGPENWPMIWPRP